MRPYYPQVNLGTLCGLFGKSRQAWYKQQKAAQQHHLEEAIIIKRVQEIRMQMPRLGTRKLYYLLTETLVHHDIKIGRDRLFDLLADCGMLVRRRKRRKVATTDSNHPYKRYPNLIKEKEVTHPDQLWVSDITYLSLTGMRFCYLSLITDAYSRKIVGYCLYPTLQKEGAVKALEMAFSNCVKAMKNNLIHHSDRGVQYCSEDYIDLLNDKEVAISMTEKGDPYENAIAERVNGILKSEFDLARQFNNYEEAAGAVTAAIRIYNQQRPHASCNYLTPEQAATQNGTLPARWKKREKPDCKPQSGLLPAIVNFKQDYLTKM